MNKYKYAGLAIGVASLLAVAAPAFAATIPATTIFNGQTQVWGNAGQTVQATFRVNIPAGEVVHAIRTKVDSQATVCMPIAPIEGAQDTDVVVSLVLPPNSNGSGYNLTAELFTTATLPQAEAMTGNLACTGANTTAYNGANVIHVLPVSGSTTGTVGTDNTPSWLAALMAAIAGLKPAPVVTPPAPVVSADCTAYAKASMGAMQGMTSPANVKLQGFLLSEGMSIPALAAGASFGFYGPQTQAANAMFLGQFSCNK